jgi:hypothetical protein
MCLESTSRFFAWQADGGNWQVYCNRAWVFAPVSVEQIVDHCAAAPCQHAGRCVEQADSYVCLCAPVRAKKTRPCCDRMFRWQPFIFAISGQRQTQAGFRRRKHCAQTNRLVFVQGSAGRDCEEETCTAELVGGLQGYIDAACCAQHPDGKCTKPPPLGGANSVPLFALPESCREAGCAVAVADAFSQCERRIYDAEVRKRAF